MTGYELTVGQLLEIIKKHKVPKDTKIIYQRIEDKYFDGIDISGMSGSEENGAINGKYPQGTKASGWESIKLKGEQYYNAVDFNKKLNNAKLSKEGKFDPEDVAPYYLRENLNSIDLEQEDLLDQYVEVFNCWYDKDNNALCLTAHY